MKLIRSWLWEPAGKDLPEFTRHYDERYVWALIAGLGRNLTPPWKLQLWVDKYWLDALFQFLFSKPLMVPLLELIPFKGPDVGGWSRMMDIYRPEYQPEGSERILAVGLDTIITGNCDWLFAWDEAPAGFIRDPFQSTTISNSVSTFNRCGATELWRRHVHAVQLGYAGLTQFDRPSEMHLMREWWELGRWSENDGCKRMPCLEESPKRLLSYKAHVLPTKGKRIDGDTSIVYFHGAPKPHELSVSSSFIDSELYDAWAALE